MALIEIGRRNYLLYLLVSHPLKMALLSPDSKAKLTVINEKANAHHYGGEVATGYDQLHRYGEAEQHEYPTRTLVSRTWAPEGYGRVLELGAGSGYFTELIATRARSVLAVEPVPDLQRVIQARCAAAGLRNVEILGVPAIELGAHVEPGTIDSVVVLQSLHHLDQRKEVFTLLARVLRPGGRLYLLEPHHNLRRAARLLRYYLSTYRARDFWTDERNWATHDFVTRGEIRSLCTRAGFEELNFSGYWIPYLRRIVRDPGRRVRLEQPLGRLPIIRHFAAILAVTARRA